ncbi:MAG: type II toxin-antitoxin system Phd/YefM family antitoxin [Prevotella sp.]|nr:type II toxin-antitoxin system Phd/YefM family antitoxin [Prevotellaceae bacterium]MDY5843295.1 type II toxin-antitoxin system Phd/YefM family antitoxin [Prevotella sp.]
MKIIDIVRYATDPISYMDEVVNGNETLLVQRPEDKSVVILSMEEYNRLKAIEWRQQSNEPPTPHDSNK